MNKHFKRLVEEARRLGKTVIDRCNLTVLFEPNMGDVPEFLAKNSVQVVASLPCYTLPNVEKQVIANIIAALYFCMQSTNILFFFSAERECLIRAFPPFNY